MTAAELKAALATVPDDAVVCIRAAGGIRRAAGTAQAEATAVSDGSVWKGKPAMAKGKEPYTTEVVTVIEVF